MFKRNSSCYPIAVAGSLALTVMVVFGVLVEAVAGMESFL